MKTEHLPLPPVQRAYTVNEIDALRRALGVRLIYGSTHEVDDGVSCDPERVVIRFNGTREECFTCTEDLVRTAMVAGHTAEDFYKADFEALLAEGHLYDHIKKRRRA